MAEKLNILLVEDQVVEAELLVRHLTRAGLHCVTTRVDTEPDFRRALQESPPELILSDFSLPQFGGMDALEIAVEMAPEIPFIFVSGTIGEERAIEALRRGATDYVLKTNLARLVPVIERALREAKARAHSLFMEHMLQDIVATSQDWIWQVDAAGRFTFSSPAVADILGYTPTELLGRHFEFLLPEEDRSHPEARLPGADQAHAALSGSIGPWRHRDGQIRWLERNAIAVRGPAGELAGYRGSDRDVTLRREQETRIRRLNRVHHMLSSINSAIVRISNRNALLEEACRIAREQGGYELAIMHLIVPGTTTLRPVASCGGAPELLADLKLPLDAWLTETTPAVAQLLRSGSPLVSNNLVDSPLELQLRNELCANGVKAVIVLPLLVDGTGVGTLLLLSREADVFDTAETNVLCELVGNIGFALQYIEKEQAVEFLSYFDPATALAKRTLFCERLARVFGAENDADRTTSIVVFDVQRLSVINDTYGHHVTNRFLQQIANRMKLSARDPELLAHFGGGTFAAAFQNSVGLDTTARTMYSEAARFFAEPFNIEGHEIQPSIRSGVACFPMDGQAADTVVQNAETALKHAQESGERHVVYGLLDRAIGDDRVRFESRLAGALSRSEFLLHYQPKVNIASGQVEGVEALLRWQDPETGLISPARFIPLLENTGRIVEVGQWVLEQAARDCQKWLEAGLPPIRVAVNVSPVQLRRDDFVPRAIKVMQSWATDAAGVDIEITEGMLRHDFESSTRKLQQLQEAGARIAIDDFGTGYSSLRRLTTLPVDTLKIDQSFIHRITESRQDLAIVRTIILLARSCGMSTVAEGVETDRQLQCLKPLHCDQAQGYLYSKPVPADILPELLGRLNPAATVELDAEARDSSRGFRG
jgi:diguanylate cyclase (GGDEF)-like protein/PAS domain S-box-containing protein